MSQLDFSQSFTKTGQLVSQYGGFEPTYDINKKIKTQQADNLVIYISNRYSKVSKVVRDKWRNEMLNMDGFEYMNIPFLAAALHIYENYYSEDEDISNVVKNIYKRDEKMEFYYDLLIEKNKKKSDEEYTEKLIVTKQFLYTYIIKIHYYRTEDEIIDNDNVRESSRHSFPSPE